MVAAAITRVAHACSRLLHQVDLIAAEGENESVTQHPPLVHGVFAALPTPVTAGGRPALDALDRLVAATVGAGVRGLCLSGATGEYPHFEVADRIAVVRRVAPRLPADRVLLVAIGAPSLPLTLDLGRAAVDAGALAVLLPMPGFFRYEQEDLYAYAATVAEALSASCLLYNLPAFTNPLAVDTMVALLEDVPAIVGLKDSSGEPSNLGALAAARGGRAWSLLVGDDRRLRDGLAAGWNGVISGTAACCPELVVALAGAVAQRDAQEADRLAALLDELTARLASLPVPWGIRVALEARGLPTGPLPLPLGANRRVQVEEIKAWFPGWLAAARIAAPGGPPHVGGPKPAAR